MGIVVFVLVVLVLIVKYVFNVKNIVLILIFDELSVLKNKFVWIILGIIIIGFGGVFCVYIYIVDIILEVIYIFVYIIFIVMIMFGIGCILGNYVLGKVVDYLLLKIIGVVLIGVVVFVVSYVSVSYNIWLLYVVIFFIGFSVGLGIVI